MDSDTLESDQHARCAPEALAPAEFAPHTRAGTVYLNTATAGLGPARAAAALRRDAEAWSVGDQSSHEAAVTAARASFARIASVSPERVAVGSAVSVHAGLIATALPSGSEVLACEGDFSSLVNPFAVRRDLKLRLVPLENIAEEIRPGTALVAVSSVQSADGRIADLDAIRQAAARHGARTLVDATQSVGWHAFDAGAFDYVTVGAYKWLLCPRGVSFLHVRESAADALPPIFAGWTAGEHPWLSSYGPVSELAHSARRFDTSPAASVYTAAAQSLSLIEEIGVERIRAHNTALAARFREGLTELGYESVPADGSPIVAVPGLGDAAPELADAGVHVAARAGNLRAAFHLYNSAADVERALEALARTRARIR